ILPKGKQHGSFSISLFTQLYGLNSISILYEDIGYLVLMCTKLKYSCFDDRDCHYGLYPLRYTLQVPLLGQKLRKSQSISLSIITPPKGIIFAPLVFISLTESKDENNCDKWKVGE
ncbi:hypothetical protein, partial [Saccharococcus caldoxylosilyticus]|uniref:hypothetical protein n=1 Tax=Saccharococcus caldoxylosilyticus TaxID=81408 RepID=UPI000AF65869